MLSHSHLDQISTTFSPAEASLEGNLEKLMWYYHNGYPLDEEVIQNACTIGHTSIVQWCLIHEIPFTTDCIEIAAYNGHIPILLTFLAFGYRIDNADIVNNAALGGHLILLKWCQSQGYPISDYILYISAKEGYLDILKWGLSIGLHYDPKVAYQAVASGNLSILKWLHSQKYRMCPQKIKKYSMLAYRIEKITASLKWCVRMEYISQSEYTQLLLSN